MANFSVGLGRIDELGRSICEPRLDGFLARESIPHTIEVQPSDIVWRSNEGKQLV